MNALAATDTRDWPFDPELLRRYDRPGPRYTSYPTAPQFHAGFDATAFRAQASAGNTEAAPRGLSLYVHVPFCRSPCFYCGCNRVVTRNHARGQVYLDRLLREIDMLAPMFGPEREVVQLHLGGGTPNFLEPRQIADLVDAIEARFRFSRSATRDFSIELDPRFIDAEGIQLLTVAGFNRASLGVQDFDLDVQMAINRVQSVDGTLEVIDACRAYGMRSINVDLIYGLPRQTLTGFGRTLDTVVNARPDRLAIYGYAHLPDLFRAQRQIATDELPTPEQKLALLGLAVEKLSAAGYRYIGMDHFALPDDELARAQRDGSLHRNFMGYTTHARTDLVGLGVSAISHVGDSFSQNHRDLPAWEAAIDAGTLPLWRGLALEHDDVLRADVIQRLMCQGEIDMHAFERDHGIDFATYFASELDALTTLRDDGLIDLQPARIRATPRGRPLLRLAAMVFDRYLPAANQPQRYSRTI